MIPRCVDGLLLCGISTAHRTDEESKTLRIGSLEAGTRCSGEEALTGDSSPSKSVRVSGWCPGKKEGADTGTAIPNQTSLVSEVAFYKGPLSTTTLFPL